MKKHRIISAALAVAMIISMSTFASANTFDISIPNAEITQDANGTYQYFENTEAYTLAMVTTTDGKILVAFNDKTEGVTSTIDVTPSNFSRSINSAFSAVRGDVLNGNLDLTVAVEAETIAPAPTTRASNDEIAQWIGEAMEIEYGVPFSNKLIGVTTRGNLTAKLYQHMSFHMYKDIEWRFAISTPWHVIAAAMSITTNQVRAIYHLVMAANGIYQLVSSAVGNKYVANALYDKEVFVVNTYPYGAGLTEYGFAYAGDKGAIYEFDRSYAHSDYYDDDLLMEIGLDNYEAWN